MGHHPALRAFFCASLLVVAPVVRAAGAAPDGADQARALAQEGGDLLDAKKYAEALERVTRAEALYHAATNVLMMGQAHEGLGHLATALGIYEKLAAEPLPPAAPRAFLEAQQTGKERLRALLARVPSILVVVRGLGADELADVRIDGEPYALDTGAAKRVDPGAHVVVVTTAAHPRLERSVVLPDRGGVVTVEMPLTSARAEGPPAAPPQGEPPPQRAADSSPAPSKGGSLVPPLVAFGVGAVGLGLGAITGAMSLANVSDLRSKCPDNRCGPGQQATIDSTKTLGVVSTVGFVVGGVGAAAGVVLLLLRHPSAEGATSGRAPTFAPWIGAGSAGVDGTF